VSSQALATVPGWLVDGVLLGLGLSVLVAALFYLLVRQFPSDQSADASTGGRRHSGDERRRAEIREYLDAIDEQYAEQHVVEGQRVAFYLPERDVAITFDARAFYHIDPTDTDAVLLEHEVPGIALGPRLPFETPEVDVGEEDASETPPEPSETAYAILGVSSGATREEIQSAYRQKVKEVHPDHGGDRDEFQRVREAYVTAKEEAP